MFEGVLLIIRKVIVFSLISFVILELTPKEEYKKYINLFVGMVLILLIFSPICRFLNSKTDFTKTMEKYTLKDEARDMEMYFTEFDEMHAQAVVSEYRDEIVKNIIAIIEEEQMAANSVEVKLNTDAESTEFLAVLEVDLGISKKYEDDSVKIREIVLEKQENAESIQVINIKNKISQFYNVEMDNININK